MAKKVVLGTVRKSDKGSFYIKLDQDVRMSKGQSISLFSKKDNLDSLEKNKEKLSEEAYTKAKERIENTPEWVKFELVQFQDN